MSHIRPIVFAAVAAIGSAFSASAAESVYTDIVISTCEPLVQGNPDEPGGDFMSAFCPGLGAYRVLFKEGDLRQSLHYGYLKKTIVDTAFESFGSFNYMGPKIEWRVDDSGRPFAAIHRFFVGDQDNIGQVLTVSRVGQPDDEEGCPVGYVDALANKDANTLAREVADTLAVSFQCGQDQPRYHGVKGPKASEPMIYHGDSEE